MTGLLRRLLVLPRCIGKHEPGHPVCDRQCKHRDVCLVVQARAKGERKKPISYVRYKRNDKGQVYAVPRNPHAMARYVKLALAALAASEGLPRKPPRPGSGPRAAMATAATERSGNHKLLDGWYREWLRIIEHRTGRKYGGVQPAASPGELYVRDRRRTSGYLGLYIKAARDADDKPVAALVWRARLVRMDVKFPIAPARFDGVSAERMKWLKPREIVKDGCWISRSRGLDLASIRMSAEVIADMVNNGAIASPE